MKYSRFIVRRFKSQQPITRSQVRNLIEDLDCDKIGYIPEGDIVRINVSGTIFETTRGTLAHYPNSLLGDSERLKQHWNDEMQAYYFDRDPDYFEDILSAYQQWPTTELQRQDNLMNFIRELAYFDMGPVLTQKVLQSYNLTLADKWKNRRSKLKQRCWDVMGSERKSKLVRGFDILRRVAILATAIAASVTSYQLIRKEFNVAGLVAATAQIVCLTFIMFDFTARIFTSGSVRHFFASLYNIIDCITLVIIATILLTLLLTVATSHNGLDEGIIRILLVCETIQLYKFQGYNDFMAAMTITFKTHYSELLCIASVMSLVAIIFGECFILTEDYFAKRNLTTTDGIWWAVTTMATIAYGDVVPLCWQGRAITVAWILVSKVLISMLIPVFATIYKDIVDGLRIARQFKAVINSADRMAKEQVTPSP